MKKEEIPCIFYLYIHSKIYEKKGKIVKTKEVLDYLHEWRIPKKIRYLIIKEMEKINLLRLNNGITELNTPKFRTENINDYYHNLGIF